MRTLLSQSTDGISGNGSRRQLLYKSVWMGSQEGMDFVIPCFREVFTKSNMEIIVEGKVGDIKRGICYFYMILD